MGKMITRIVLVFALVAGLATAALALWTEVIMGDVAEPAFTVLREDGDFALREYAPMIVAEVRVSGARGPAISEGFRALAGYIFGGNTPGEKIAMTAPVLQTPAGAGEGVEIAMTAPVLQSPAGGDSWVVQFVMPERFTLDTLPAPDDARVSLVPVPGQRVAAVRFSGFHRQSTLDDRTAALRDWMAAEDLTPAGPPRFAFYDPPWTLPFLRRNEVLIPVNP